MKLLFKIILLFSIQSHLLWSQSLNNIRGKVIDKTTGLPIPSILVISGKSNTLTDVQGYFSLDVSQKDTLVIDDFDYNYFEYKLDSNLNTYYIISLNKIKKQRFKLREQKRQRLILDTIFSRNKKNSIYNKGGFTYSTYNKLTINTDNEEQNYNLINYLKKLIPKRYFDFEYNPKHHIFLMESSTEKKYRNKVHQKEIVHNSKVSGISRSTIFTFTSDYQFTTVYEKYLFFNLTNYINPLHKKGYKRYNFYLSDTIVIGNKPKILIKFYPKNKNLFDAIQGAYVWDINDSYIESIYIRPSRETDLFSSLSQKYIKDTLTGRAIPSITITSIKSTALDHKNISLNATAKTYMYNFKGDNSFESDDFDENVYEYRENYDEQYDTLNWVDLRKEDFSDYDSSTFAFYEKVGQVKNLEKVINVGRNIYNGKVGIQKMNLLLNKVFNYNRVEGLRLGAGVETNDRFSKKYYGTAYMGYGFEDQTIKYGGLIGMRLVEEWRCWVKVGYSDDLAEPGRVEHQFDRQQYSSESFRKYQLQLLDNVKRTNILTYLQPFKYAQAGIGFNNELVTPHYDYQYDQTHQGFHFREVIFMFNYAYGRQFIKYADKQVYFRDKFPIVSFQISNSLPGGNVSYEYTKYDLKLSYNFWFLSKGNHNIQLNLGYMNGQSPYFKLYNSKGSFSNLYTTIYNSFETMSYNEFCSDKYISVFYNVNFGRLNRVGRFKPSFVFSHNMGWGSLNNRELHQNLVFNTMEKGYYESGFTLGDILRYNLYGLKIGLGVSVFYRYGDYRYADHSKNFVLKLATSFRI